MLQEAAAKTHQAGKLLGPGVQGYYRGACERKGAACGTASPAARAFARQCKNDGVTTFSGCSVLVAFCPEVKACLDNAAKVRAALAGIQRPALGLERARRDLEATKAEWGGAR